MATTTSSAVQMLELPPPDDHVLPGVPWGRFDNLFTPAFWAGRAWLAGIHGEERRHKLGRNLREEIAACLLGGFGIPAEIGIAAFTRLRERGLLSGTPSVAELSEALHEPLCLGGRLVRYRFASQKARYLSEVLRREDEIGQATDDVAFRDSLARLPGVGLKTASWITRNSRDSDAVAILDVHVCRACSVAGVFQSRVNLRGEYRRLENRYLQFSNALGVRASVLDALMWENMRRLSRWIPGNVRN